MSNDTRQRLLNGLECVSGAVASLANAYHELLEVDPSVASSVKELSAAARLLHFRLEVKAGHRKFGDGLWDYTDQYWLDTYGKLQKDMPT